jgi:CRP-like cAMP-binding protein
LPDEGEEYLVSVEAVYDSYAYAWDHAAIRSLAESFPTLMEILSVVLREYVRLGIGHRKALLADTPSERLGHMILEYLGKGGEIEMTNDESATATNFSPYKVSRVIGKSKQQGAVRRDGAKLLVLSPEKLVVPVATRP